MSHGYELNEADIDKVLNYLRIIRPEKATPEMAISILESMYVAAHKSAAHGEQVDIDKAIEQALKEIEGRSKGQDS